MFHFPKSCPLRSLKVVEKYTSADEAATSRCRGIAPESLLCAATWAGCPLRRARSGSMSWLTAGTTAGVLLDDGVELFHPL